MSDPSSANLFQTRWPSLKARIDGLRLKTLKSIQLAADYYGDDPVSAGLRPDMEAVLCGLLDEESSDTIAKGIKRLEVMDNSVASLEAAILEGRSGMEVEFLLNVVSDLLDVVEELLGPWVTEKRSM